VDVRDFAIRNSINAYFGQISHIIGNIYQQKSYSMSQLKQLSEQIQIIQSEISTLYINLYKNHNLFNPKFDQSMYSAHESKMYNISPVDNYFLTQQFISKILTKYENASVKKIIVQIIQTELHDMFINYLNQLDQVLTKIHEIISELNKFEHNPSEILLQQSDHSYFYGIDRTQHLTRVLELRDMSNSIFNFIDIGVYLMDLYLLRRALDKNYVTNIIAYTGAHHSQNYIRLLIKYFGFDLTKWSYLKTDAKKATQIIKQSRSFLDLSVLFSPVILVQCSNIKSFPKLFY
ncbi:MAG TPA: hypothetical protein VKR58_13060, partial [Aquella sp.]|nr:hypothetical protein [Aquella sp.]